MEEDSWGGPALVWPATHTEPVSGVIGMIEQVSLEGLSLERKLSGKEVTTSSWRLMDSSRSYSLSAEQDAWVGSSSSSLLAPASCTADATLRLSH